MTARAGTFGFSSTSGALAAEPARVERFRTLGFLAPLDGLGAIRRELEDEQPIEHRHAKLLARPGPLDG